MRVLRLWRRREESILLAAAGLVIALAGLLPLLWPPLSLLGGGGAALGSALEDLHLSRLGALLARSLLLAALVTAAALAGGIPFGFLLGRTDAPGKRAAFLLHVAPLFLPPFLAALGWSRIIGRGGIFLGETGSRLLYSDLGLVAVLALALAPVATCLTALSLRHFDPSFEEAARTAARPWRVATRILLPATLPANALAGLVVFALAFLELGVPVFLRREVYPAAVFARLAGASFTPGEAFLLFLPLLPIVLALLFLERRLLGSRPFTLLGLRSAERASLPLGRWRWPAAVLLWAMALLSLAPIAALFLIAAGGGGFARISGPDWSSARTSLLLAIASATLTTVLALVAGHALARGRAAARWIDAGAVLVFFAPAALLGIGLISLWNRPGLQAVYTSLAILVLGHTARYSTLGLRAAGVSFSQSSFHLEEAAAACGAGFLRRLLLILAPIHWRGIAGAWILVLIFSLRDLEMSVLYHPPGMQPLTVRIFTQEAGGTASQVAALACLQILITAAPVAAGAWLVSGSDGA